MSTATPYGYALRVDGHLDRHWRSRFGDLELTHHDDGTSTLAGPVADQSQLHGLLAGLRDIGATLLSVRPVDLEDNRATFEDAWAQTEVCGASCTSFVSPCTGLGSGSTSTATPCSRANGTPKTDAQGRSDRREDSIRGGTT
jgi:hypothetical protein